MKNIIIDFDPGNFLEDLIMLGFSSLSEEFNILGVFPTHNPFEKDKFSELKVTRKFLRLIGKENIPCFQGLSWFPVQSFPKFLKQNAFHDWAKDEKVIETEDEIIKIFENNFKNILEKNNDIHIIATGPLTNISYIYDRFPNLFLTKIKSITFLGTSINTSIGGIMEKCVEYNVLCDVLSAKKFLKIPIEKVIVPLDTVYDLIIYKEQYQSFVKKSKYGKIIDNLREIFLKEWNKFEGEPGGNVITIMDTFASSTLLEKDIGYFINYQVAFDDKGYLKLFNSENIKEKENNLEYFEVTMYTKADRSLFFKKFREAFQYNKAYS
jgi:inosine-uridine nucleoside N-ribohydrolase